MNEFICYRPVKEIKGETPKLQQMLTVLQPVETDCGDSRNLAAGTSFFTTISQVKGFSWLPHCQENQEKQKKKDKSPEKPGENGGFRKKVMKSPEIWYKNAVNKKVYHH